MLSYVIKKGRTRETSLIALEDTNSKVKWNGEKALYYHPDNLPVYDFSAFFLVIHHTDRYMEKVRNHQHEKHKGCKKNLNEHQRKPKSSKQTREWTSGIFASLSFGWIDPLLMIRCCDGLNINHRLPCAVGNMRFIE